ncbi:MAG: hypothetical protein ACXAB4_01670 [Candidatus Hodarchaeales archaeon]
MCVQAIATLPLPSRSRILVVVPQKADLKPYQEALQIILPDKMIVTSTDLRERKAHSQQADVLIGTVHQSLTWLLQQRINPERVIIVAPEKAIRAYQRVQRNVIPPYEALFLRLSIRQKYWRQVMLISQEPLLMLRSYDIGLIQEYFEHPEAEFNYDVNDELLPLSDDDLDGLLLTLLWRKHWTATKIYRLLQRGASQGGLLLKQAPSREKIIERLKHLQAQFESSLVAQARSPATHWTTTLQGRALLAWGFVSTQTQALEDILQEEESSASQLLQLFRTMMGPRKNPDALQKLLEWVSTYPADEPLPGSLTKRISQLSYPIRYLARFYAHRLNVRSHQLLQRLTEVLQKTEQDGQDAPRAVEPKRKGIFETRHKRPPQISFKDVLKLVNRVGSPVSVSMVAEKLACPRWVARYWLEKLSTCQKASLEKRVVTDGTQRCAYYAKQFPSRFETQCRQCHWFARKHCALWRTLRGLAPKKLPKACRKRAWALHPGSIACEEYHPTVVTRTVHYHHFQRKQGQTYGWDSQGHPTTGLACMICDKPLPLLHEGTERCGHCGTAYRLGRDQEQNIVVLISPDLDHLLVEAIQRWIGLPGFQRQTTFQGIRYFSIYPDDQVSLDSDVLVIGRTASLVQYQVQQLTFLRLHCDLPPNITSTLDQAKVKLYHLSEKTAKAATSSLLEDVLDFGRRSQAFNHRLGENNLISRALLWHRQLPTHQQGYSHFLNAWARLTTETGRELVTAYEGQAAASLWTEIHKLARHQGFFTQARVPERYVVDRGDRPAFGSCAYSSFHALVNGLFAAGYRACRQLDEAAGLGSHEGAGLLHYRESKSLLDTLGLQLDLADILKPLFLNELLDRIKAKALSPQAAWFFHGRRCERIYYLPYRTKLLVQECVEAVLASPVTMNGEVMPLRDAYLAFLRNFRQALLEVYREAMLQPCLFRGTHFTGVGLATLPETHPDVLTDPQALAEYHQLWREVQQRARQCAEQRLAPLILASNAEEETLIQELLSVLEIAL